MIFTGGIKWVQKPRPFWIWNGLAPDFSKNWFLKYEDFYYWVTLWRVDESKLPQRTKFNCSQLLQWKVFAISIVKFEFPAKNFEFWNSSISAIIHKTLNFSGLAQHNSLKIEPHKLQHVQINSSSWHLVLFLNFCSKIFLRKKVVKWSSFLNPLSSPSINWNHLGF